MSSIGTSLSLAGSLFSLCIRSLLTLLLLLPVTAFGAYQWLLVGGTYLGELGSLSPSRAQAFFFFFVVVDVDVLLFVVLY